MQPIKNDDFDFTPMPTDFLFPTLNQANIPGDSLCELCVFDQDLVGSDDLIGTTRIDIENRWLNEKWKVFSLVCFWIIFVFHVCEIFQAMKKKPLEVRPLFAPSSRSSVRARILYLLFK